MGQVLDWFAVTSVWDVVWHAMASDVGASLVVAALFFAVLGVKRLTGRGAATAERGTAG